MRIWIRLAVLLPSLLLISAPTPATAVCTKKFVLRPAPEGWGLPALVVECDESATPALLQEDAVEVRCGGIGDADDRQACEVATERARAALRKAKIRAALRRGDSDETVAARYGATEAELEKLRSAIPGELPEADTPFPLPESE